MPGFEDEFARGEAEARRLVERMRAALGRAEQYEAQAAREARFQQRRSQRPSGVARQLGPGVSAAGGDDLRRRLAEEDQLTRQVRDRGLLRGRETEALQAQEQAMRRLRAVGPAAYTQGVLFGPAGGVPRQLPPGGGYPPVPPPGGGYRPALPPGPPPPLQLGRGPQLALPAAGETSGRLIEAQGQSAQQAASGFKAYESAQAGVTKGQVPLNKSISEALFIQGQANNQYQRFGALSAEWIGAASRGATTVQELGRQTAITIGKFGGWLVAGSLLFTALGAIRQIGAGAIKASSGVLELQRVVKDLDPELAKAQFRERAERFNVPIEIVSGAAFESGKVFKDQNDALEATEATLYAVKVGELEYAEASRYLNAILRGFNLDAKDSKVIFDQINAAQNEFGISIRDSAAGIAKAAGTFRAAGGDFDSLLAIIATAQKATGQSGQVVGTAIARAPNFLRQESNRKILQGFGIDARQGIDEVIEQAFQKAQSLSGERLQELASAIFGPQYGARIGTPLLQNFEQYQEVMEKTSPEKARGSAQRELNILLGQFDELLKKIVTELEILGSNLEQAGFLDVFGAGVKLLGQFLSGVNSLLELFNALPTPLRKTLAILLQLYGIVKLLRHFNLGESFQAGSLGRRAFTSPNQFKKLYGEDLRGQTGALIGERERATATASRAAIGLGVTEQRAVVAEAEHARLVGVHGFESQKALSQQQVVNRTQLAKNGAEERLLAAQLAEQEILVAQKLAEDKSTALAGARNEAAARGVAARHGDPVSATFNRPVTATQAARERGLRITQSETGAPRFVPIGEAEGPGETRFIGSVTGEITDLTGRERVIQGRLRDTGRAWRTLGRTQLSLRRPLRMLSTGNENARQAFAQTRMAVGTTARIGLKRAGLAIGRAGTALRGLARQGYAFIGGPIGLLIAGIYAATQFGDDLGRALAGGQGLIEAQENEFKPKSAKALRKNLESFKTLTDKEMEELQAVGVGTTKLPGSEFTIDQARRARQELRNQRALQEQDLPAVQLLPDQLEEEVKGLQSFTLGSKKFREQFKRVREEFELADKDADPKGFKEAKGKLDQLGAKLVNMSILISGSLKAFSKAAREDLVKQLESLGPILSGGPTFTPEKYRRRFIGTTQQLVVRDLMEGSLKERAEAIERLSQAPEELAAYGKEEFDLALKLARTQRQRHRAYGGYIDQLRRSQQLIRRQGRTTRAPLQRGLGKAEAELERLENIPGFPAETVEGEPGGARQAKLREAEDKRQRRIKGIKASIRKFNKAIDVLDKFQRRQLAEFKAIIREIHLEEVQEDIGLLDVRSQIKQVRIGDKNPVAQAREGVRAASEALRLLRGAGADDREIADAFLGLLQAEADLQDAIASQAEELRDATANLREARAHGDPIIAAKVNLDRARGELRSAETVAERKNALAKMIQAQDQLDEAYADLAVARIGLQLASTEDPVKEANLKLRQANIELRGAKGKGRQAVIEARTRRREAVRERRNTINEERVKDLEFEHSLDRITDDQLIAGLERILKTGRISKELRRRVRQQIHQLKNETDDFGNLELAVGNIKLPTIYDIRRAIGGGLNQQPTAVYNDNSNNTMHATVSGGNPDQVLTLMGDTFDRHTRNARRSAGQIPRR